MKLPTVKYPSGLEVSLAAWLLKMASLDVGRHGDFMWPGNVPA